MVFNINPNPHIQALRQPFQPPKGAHLPPSTSKTASKIKLVCARTNLSTFESNGLPPWQLYMLQPTITTNSTKRYSTRTKGCSCTCGLWAHRLQLRRWRCHCPDTYLYVNTTSPSIVLKSVARLQGIRNEPSDIQIGVEGASDDANTEADSDAPYPSDSTQDALGDY